jgi:hypothetical protein
MGFFFSGDQAADLLTSSSSCVSAQGRQGIRRKTALQHIDDNMGFNAFLVNGSYRRRRVKTQQARSGARFDIRQSGTQCGCVLITDGINSLLMNSIAGVALQT